MLKYIKALRHVSISTDHHQVTRVVLCVRLSITRGNNTSVRAGPQQWRFINYIIKGFWKLESVCWRTRLYILGWDIIAFPAGRIWELHWQHFPECRSLLCKNS